MVLFWYKQVCTHFLSSGCVPTCCVQASVSVPPGRNLFLMSCMFWSMEPSELDSWMERTQVCKCARKSNVKPCSSSSQPESLLKRSALSVHICINLKKCNLVPNTQRTMWVHRSLPVWIFAMIKKPCCTWFFKRPFKMVHYTQKRFHHC